MRFFEDRVNMIATEDEIDMGTSDSYSAVYVLLESQDSDSCIFCSTILADDRILPLLAMIDTNEKNHAIMDSFSVI